MKRIALLADGWKRLITYEWIMGIKLFDVKGKEPYVIDHFNCMGNWNDDVVYNQGEYNIFNFAFLEKYDGIIIDVTNIREENQLNLVLDRVRNSKIPAVSIGHYVPGLYYVGVGNYIGISRFMEHLYDKHNCRRFVYAGGPVENVENQLRLKAFKDFVSEKELEEDSLVFYGNFEVEAGVRHFDNYLKSGRKMPDAFVCANDNIAVGLIETAKKVGYKVPQDFIVTGFDNLDKAKFYDPQITSIDHNRAKLGKKCIEILYDLWAGKEVEKEYYLEPDMHYSESCGCPLDTAYDFKQIAKDSIIYNAKSASNYEKLTALDATLGKCNEFAEVFETVGDYYSQLECDDLILAIDERILNLEDSEQLPVMGYDIEHLRVVFKDGRLTDIPMKELIEEVDHNYGKGNDAYSVNMLTPLHYRDKAFGITILRNGRFLFDNPYFYDINSMITRVLWEMYQRKSNIAINKKFYDLYNKDALTGLYNRRAYFEKVEKFFADNKKQGICSMLLFIDCDNFKRINDELGHDAGDEILKRIGSILKDNCKDRGQAFRFGGDEFVVIFPCKDKEEGRIIEDGLKESFEAAAIQVSIGGSVAETDSTLDFKDYLNMADQAMYDIKKAKKKGL